MSRSRPSTWSRSSATTWSSGRPSNQASSNPGNKPSSGPEKFFSGPDERNPPTNPGGTDLRPPDCRSRFNGLPSNLLLRPPTIAILRPLILIFSIGMPISGTPSLQLARIISAFTPSGNINRRRNAPKCASCMRYSLPCPQPTQPSSGSNLFLTHSLDFNKTLNNNHLEENIHEVFDQKPLRTACPIRHGL